MLDLQCLQEEEEKCLHCGEALVYNRGIFMERCYFLIQNKSKQTLICGTVIFVLMYLGRGCFFTPGMNVLCAQNNATMNFILEPIIASKSDRITWYSNRKYIPAFFF